MESEGLKSVHNCQHLISPAFPAVILNFLDDTHYKYVYIIPGKWLVTTNWRHIRPPVQLLLQQSKYFHGNKNLHLFYKAWDDRGKYRIRTPTFFHTTYVNSLTSEYKHMTILFSKENDTNEWMILFLLKIIHYINIDFAQFKKIKIKKIYKNLYLIQITKHIQKHSSLISYTILLYLDIQK